MNPVFHPFLTAETGSVRCAELAGSIATTAGATGAGPTGHVSLSYEAR